MFLDMFSSTIYFLKFLYSYVDLTLLSIFLSNAFIYYGTLGKFGCLKLYSLYRVMLSSMAARCFILLYSNEYEQVFILASIP